MLRPATAADAAAIGAVTEDGFEGYRSFAPPGWEPPQDMGGHGVGERLARPGVWGVVAEEDSGVVGFGAFEPARVMPDGPELAGLAHVWAVFVAERCWGTGVAVAIMEALLAEIGARGFPEARLFVAAGQLRARAFYAREGWREISPPRMVPELGLELVEMRRAV